MPGTTKLIAFVVLGASLLSGCAGTPPAGVPEAGAIAASRDDPTPIADTAEEQPESLAESPVVAPPSDPGEGPLEEPDTAKEPLLDRTQQTVYSVVNSTSRWFDGFFGTPPLNNDEQPDVSRGLLAVGQNWDQRDDFDTRVRFRAQIPLPALEHKTRLLLGRGDTDDIVDGSETETINSLPVQFSDFSDDDVLIGLGYRQKRGMRNGFDLGIGAKVSSSNLDPYARLDYRWSKGFGDSVLWRLRPRVFWQEERGNGASLSSILDYVLGPRWLLRSWINLLGDEEIEGVRWRSDFLAYQSISDRNALAYRLFAIGETGSEVELQDYGLELRFRRRIMREWLFLELATSLSWPREFLTERRESNLGVAVEIEMQFGDWPGRDQEAPARSQPAETPAY